MSIFPFRFQESRGVRYSYVSLMFLMLCFFDKTQNLIYLFRRSYDEGETWHLYKFTNGNERVRVYDILTEPGEKSTVFTIYASYGESHSWEILEIDMKPILSKSERKIISHVFLKFFVKHFAGFVRVKSSEKKFVLDTTKKDVEKFYFSFN